MCGKSWKDQLLEDLIVINKFIHYAEQPNNNNKVWHRKKHAQNRFLDQKGKH